MSRRRSSALTHSPTVAGSPGSVKAPAVFADYRGTRNEATVEETGAIRLGSETFTSPSMAAVAARKRHGYTGKGKAAINGWTFWHFTDAHGVVKPLNELRS